VSIKQKEITAEIQKAWDKFQKERDFTNTSTNVEYLVELGVHAKVIMALKHAFAAGFHAKGGE